MSRPPVATSSHRLPSTGWAGRFQRWWESRHTPTDHWVLTQRNVYILPTGTGLAFAALLLALLLASINYQLSLGYLLTFALAASAVASMHITHATLSGLHLRLQPVGRVSVGETLTWTLVIDNPGRARWGLGFAWGTRRVAASAGLAAPSGSPVWLDIGAQSQASVNLTAQAVRRGHWLAPPIALETRFPLGLFRAWTWWRPATLATVWPQPEQPCPPMPGAQTLQGSNPDEHDDATPQAPSMPQATLAHGEAEIVGLRPYRPGDRLNQIAWRRVPADGGWLSLDTQLQPPDRPDAPVHLRWSDTASLGDEEARWSRLAAWVERAHETGQAFALHLPDATLAMGEGPEHRRQALDALAGPKPKGAA